jgi:hypothetical protein
MFEFFQHFLHIGPQGGTDILADGEGSYASLGTAAVLVAVAIWRRGRRD